MRSTFDYIDQANMDVRSGAVGFDLWLGGTIAPGLALGGALFFNSADKAKDQNTNLEAGLTQTDLGLFVDGFPDPTGGLDFGGCVAVANTDSSGSVDIPSPQTSGFGFAAWGGYTAWVSDNWSLGGLARLSLARTRGKDSSDNEIKSSSYAVILEFAALYH